MPVGYHKKCKICNSEQRAAAETLHENGTSFRKIADYLSNNGVDISYQAVKRHFDNHFAPKDEAAKRYYEESEAVHEQAVGKRLGDLDMLDEIIVRNYQLHQGAYNSIQESLATEYPVFGKNGRPILDPEDPTKQLKRKYPPAKPMVDLLNGTAAEVRQAVKLKKDLLGEGSGDGTTIVFVDDIHQVDDLDLDG